MEKKLIIIRSGENDFNFIGRDPIRKIQGFFNCRLVLPFVNFYPGRIPDLPPALDSFPGASRKKSKIRGKRDSGEIKDEARAARTRAALFVDIYN